MNSTDWIPFTDLDFNDGNTCYHIDTRDFCGIGNDHTEDIDLHKTLKNPNEYFHTEGEIKDLLKRYYEESGGEAGWRMISLDGYAKFRTQNWQLKYIRIFKLEQGLVIYNPTEKFLFGKRMLACPINQKFLHTH